MKVPHTDEYGMTVMLEPYKSLEDRVPGDVWAGLILAGMVAVCVWAYFLG